MPEAPNHLRRAFGRETRPELVNAFLAAQPAEMRRLVEAEAEALLDPAVEALLRAGAAAAAAVGDTDRSDFFTAHADLLAACRSRGAAAAFAPLQAAGGPADGSGDIAAALAELRDLAADQSAEHDRGKLERQIVLCRRILSALPRQANGELWAGVQGTLGNALQSLGALAGDADTLRQAAAAFRATFEEYTRGRAPMDWAAAQTGLGNALQSLGALGDADALRQAVAAYRAALEEYTRERAPMNWAAAQHGLGTALRSLGALAGDAASLRQAVAAYRAALEERTRERAPMDWAGTQNNLGNALQSLGALGDADALRQAVAAYRAALEEYTRERAPMHWAAAQTGLGTALESLVALAGDADALRQAVAAYRAALEEYTRERAPMDWATIQNGLGTALQSLGDFAGDADAVRQAVAAYRAALEERTRERAPMDWAGTQNNLGTALRSLGNLAGDADALRRAVAAYRAALEECTRERAPMHWAGTQNNLGAALESLGELAGDADALRQAVAAYRAALKESTRERAPMNWAAAQHGLGTAFLRVGALAGDADALRQAVAAYRAALKESTRERAPMDWAAAQHGLGQALERLGDLAGDADTLRQAVAAYRAALEEFDARGAEDNRQGTAGTLAQLLARLGRYDEAAAVIGPTLARSDAVLIDAARSRDGRTRAVERVGELYSVGSLCRLRQDPPDIAAALVTAEAGRTRLLADALALDETRIEELAAEVRQQILAARDERDGLRHRLGFAPAAWTDAARTGRIETALRRAPAPEDRAALEAQLRRAGDHYLALCRQYGLIAAPEPLSYREILQAAPEGGALVMPVVTESEAFVFVVAAGGGEATVVDLARLDRQKLVAHLNEGWVETYYTAVHSPGLTRRNPAYQDWNRQIAATQAWLWEVLLEPIDTHLRSKARLKDDAPVVLLPPGLLGLLPLQAAGPGPDGRYFCEHWTVSFAPSVKSLLTCRQRLAERREVPAKLLAVIDPPGQTPLAGARAEAAMLRRLFACAEQMILEGGAAKLQPVLQHLPSATYVHPSTHGRHDPLQPQLSSLHLADIPLRLEMLHDTRLEVARLVFLSACESGLAGVRKMPEEFIGLPAGFVQAGAAAVAGSLWPVFDDAAFLLSSKFYELHLDDRGNEQLAPAVALRRAQDWLRHVTYRELKTMFPITHDAAGAHLELYQAPRMPVGTETIRPLSLPLGPDADCPYAQPHEWAAFTLTGV